MGIETITIWEVFTETGSGYWSCHDTEDEAMSRANRLSAKQQEPYFVRRQDNILHDLVEVLAPPEVEAPPEIPPQGSLFE